MTIVFLWTKDSFLWKIWFSLNERPKQSLYLNFYNRYFYRITLIVLLLSCLFFVTHSNASSSLQDMTISFLWIKEPFDWKDMIQCNKIQLQVFFLKNHCGPHVVENPPPLAQMTMTQCSKQLSPCKGVNLRFLTRPPFSNL